jgi:hypothetical protein
VRPTRHDCEQLEADHMPLDCKLTAAAAAAAAAAASPGPPFIHAFHGLGVPCVCRGATFLLQVYALYHGIYDQSKILTKRMVEWQAPGPGAWKLRQGRLLRRRKRRPMARPADARGGLPRARCGHGVQLHASFRHVQLT